MKNLFSNTISGALNRLKKSTHRPYSVFDISWLKEKYLKHSTAKNIITHTYKSKYKISFSDRSAFLLSVRELFVEEIYKFKTNNPSPYIIDCGSHIGMSLLYFSIHYKNARIRGFEPDPFNYELARKNILQCGLSNAELINAAIWINNDTVQFASSGNMASSIFQSSSEGDEKTNPIKAIRLKDILDEKVDFLKIDIEGAEYDVLMDCGDKLTNVENLFIEYHSDFNEIYKLNAILDLLVKNNFFYYIKEAGNIFPKPFWEHEKKEYSFDVQLNIFCFKTSS